ncbi:hypothetical protein [Chengkuizengella axinellae]|uniref:Uncharacterized protein n=1 Tax=Chengkuizengella axinellae TaxID=3064388 RepID=A0ABT9IYP4_9BACL|nr:hypothetical protein [Chengkuizengella sp. 2205SS18-9]MDP5274348.1 hypothetical protein [Chengkuizengella sp. 2205SS18-9]
MFESKVIKDFRDKYSTNVFKKGDTFTSEKKERIEELEKLGYIKTEEKTETVGPKHVGGGMYELPNGEKVKGKKEAQARFEEITREND